jgi:hypothetical protein
VREFGLPEYVRNMAAEFPDLSAEQDASCGPAAAIFILSDPFRVPEDDAVNSQGFTLGCSVRPFQGRNSARICLLVQGRNPARACAIPCESTGTPKSSDSKARAEIQGIMIRRGFKS